MRSILAAMVLLMLAACGSRAPAPAPAQRPAPNPVARAGADVAQAMTTPLADLNLVHALIPPVLGDAVRAPYAEPPDGTCAGLTAHVQSLDAALGPDLDTPATANDPGLVERGVGLAGQAATSSVRGAAESVVPFRSWVRRLSGAERYSREVAAAIAAGTVRRGYLKGLGQARGCRTPAAPAAASDKP